jgi:2,3-bisphosphoglycerate-independent phosphoglycerate mutase
MGVHSWHPVPLLLYSGVCGSDDVQRFTEKECAKGGIGRMSAKYLMGLLLANAGRLKKFGA